MSVLILKKEDAAYKKEEDSANTEPGLRDSIAIENKVIEEGSHGATTNGEENIDDIRRKIVDFIKSQGYTYAEGEREFGDETNDLFTKGGTLVELAITIGVDSEVIKQIMEDAN
jgi:hypothetical protein